MEKLFPGRPYTGPLGDQVECAVALSRAPSVISDAGLQQQLRHQQATLPPTDVPSHIERTDSSPETAPGYSALIDLQGELFHALVSISKNESNIPGLGFLPQEKLHAVVNPKSVAEQLTMDLSSTHSSEQMLSYANAVCSEAEVVTKGRNKLKSFRKIFAILVMVEMSSSISHFLEDDVSDLDLPLVPIRKGGVVIELRRRDSKGIAASTPLPCLRRSLWSLGKLRHFEHDQWITLAPFFHHSEHGEVNHYILQDQHILPFVATNQVGDDDAEYHGGYAKVMMVRIHHAHHDFPDKVLGERGFAVKQLFENDRRSFERESRMLKKFSGGRGHKHIVSLLATYEQREKFHFIFYRAGGDLFRYWKTLEQVPLFNYTNILWVSEQLAGMAEGLMKLHRHLTLTLRHIDVEDEHRSSGPSEERRVKFTKPIMHVRADSLQFNGVRVRPSSPTLRNFKLPANNVNRSKSPEVSPNPEVIELEQFGRHGDITPGNILWYGTQLESAGTLSGTLKIADFGQAELNSKHSRTRERSVANTLTYRPPECDVQPNLIRQSYDIWCLGCVYLEFVTWMLGGASLLLQFSRLRNTPDRYMNNEKTDTFFEFVESSDSNPEVQVKSRVIEVNEVVHRRLNFRALTRKTVHRLFTLPL